MLLLLLFTWTFSSFWMMMCFTAFCHIIFFRRSPGDSGMMWQVGSRSSMGETIVVSAKVTMMMPFNDPSML